jgi:hypothetical protein
MYAPSELAVSVCPASVITPATAVGKAAAGVGRGIGMVLLPMIITVADWGAEMPLPETVIAGPPGVRVFESIIMGDVGLARLMDTGMA